jgi:hypothetical protein
MIDSYRGEHPDQEVAPILPSSSVNRRPGGLSTTPSSFRARRARALQKGACLPEPERAHKMPSPRRVVSALADRPTELCWVCRRQVQGLEGALVGALLPHLKSRNPVPGCHRGCEVLQAETSVVLAHFFHLACGHYCASHSDHHCCVCRREDSL